MKSRTSAACFLILAASLALCRHSVGAILIWSNPAGGSASTPSNWNPVQVPTGADQLLFAINGSYDVSFNSIGGALLHSYSAGDVSLSFSTHSTQQFLIADNNSNNATVTIVPGELTASVLRIADESTTNGTLTVDGPFTDVNFATAIVGNSGVAELNVIFGADFTAGSLIVGSNASASGVVNVNTASTFPPNSPLLFAGTGVIGGSGDGDLNIIDGGAAEFAGHLALAPQSGSTGDVLVDGPDSSTLTVGGDLFIASNETTANAGTAVFTLADNATVDVAGTTWVGDASGSNGTLRLDGNGEFKTGSLRFATSFSAFDLRNGHLIIDGGAINPIGVSLVIDSPTGDIPIVELRNGATYENESFGLIQIGSGQLTLTSGSNINITQSASVGNSGDDLGTLMVEDGSTLAVSSLGIGAAGNGAVIVNSKGTINTPSIALAFATPSGFGTLDVLGPGAVVNTDELDIGGGATGPQGVGIVTVGDSGVINVNEPGGINSTVVYPDGVIHALEDGIIDIDSSMNVQGLVNMLGGTIIADNVSITGDLEGYGFVNADITIQTNGVITPGGGDLLTVGDHFDNNGFNGNLGLLNVSEGEIRIQDANGASLGNTTLDGGTLDLIDNGTLLASRTLSGNGTVKGDLINLGTITNSGGLGLRFLDGTLTSENHTINGNRITFGPGSDFEGFGTITCAVIGEAGSEIIATGNLTMGNQLDPTGVSLGGSLNVGPHTVTMLDFANGVPLGTFTTINGGTLIQGIRVSLGVDDVLSGTGLIDSQLSNSGGTIRPGGNFAIGTLNVDSAFTSGSGPVVGNLEFEIAGLNSVDRLACNSSAALDGTLLVKPISGFVPQLDQEFVVLTASSIAGAFDDVSLLNAPSTLAAQAIISATQVKVKIIANPCPADTTPPGGNGAVDVDDLLTIINSWGPCPAPPTSCFGDIAPNGGNGAINVDDLLAVINAWGGCP